MSDDLQTPPKKSTAASIEKPTLRRIRKTHSRLLFPLPTMHAPATSHKNRFLSL